MVKRIEYILLILVLSICVKDLYAQSGKVVTNKATYYSDRFVGRRTSSGEVFSQKLLTAAHNTLPLQTIVRVTNKTNGKMVLVKINDRCARSGLIDLTKAAFKRLGLKGTSNVNVEVLGKEYIDIWKIQDSLYRCTACSYDFQVKYLDSLILNKGLIIEGNYYIRLEIVEGENRVKEVLSSIPSKYITLAEAEKIYNENFYYIDIGPFVSQNASKKVINELKKQFPAAHIVKKE